MKKSTFSLLAIFSLSLALCVVAKCSASQPGTYNVDSQGSVSVGDKKDVGTSKTDKVDLKEVKRDMRSMNDCGGRKGR